MTSPSAKLLIVEDSTELLEIWRILFRSSAYRARFCRSCGEALHELSSGFAADVLITDYYLPDMTGVELIEKVQESYAGMRYVLLTGNSDQGFVDQIKSRGDVELLLKPAPFRVLISSIKKVLDQVPSEVSTEASRR